MEETHVNLNQGAESTLSYLMARLTVDKYRDAWVYQKESDGLWSADPLKNQLGETRNIA